MTPRIYHNNFPTDVNAGFLLTLAKDKSHHLIRVLRKHKGDTLHVFDGNGNAWAARITEADATACTLCIDELLTAASVDNKPPPIHVAQCICAPAKMDWLLEKCCELGMQTFTPLHSSKTESKAVMAARSQRQQNRWQRLLIAACEQCGRNHLPTLNPMQSLTDFAAAANKDALKLHLTPHTNTPLAEYLQTPYPTTILIIGPESGITESESQALTQQGFHSAKLNNATLRTETAALTALAIINHHTP